MVIGRRYKMCKFAIVTNHYIAYTLVNLKLTWRVCRYVSLFARLENITDARHTINRGYTIARHHRHGRLPPDPIVCRWQGGGEFF